jgi:hypothetical protein
MALGYSEEVEATPEELIADAHAEFRKVAPKVEIDVSRGRTGYCDTYQTLDEALSVLKEYRERFPVGELIVRITPINQ